jgi:hypothetical protein
MTGRELSNPLQSLLSKAASALPVITGETSRAKQRLDNPGWDTAIVCDCSESMSGLAGGRSKITLLREALDAIVAELPSVTLIAFATKASRFNTPAELPPAYGDTGMELGLTLQIPALIDRYVVISDGQPNSEERALAAADRLNKRIDVLYIGPETDTAAIAFMNRLARKGGRVTLRDIVRDVRPSLVAPVREILGLPNH